MQRGIARLWKAGSHAGIGLGALAALAVTACTRDGLGATAPELSPAPSVLVVAGVEFTALDDLKARSVLWLSEEERAPLLGSADSVEVAVHSGVVARINRSVGALREAATVLPAAEASALDLSLEELAKLLELPSFIPTTPDDQE
ncbi:MAG: hypothetical protein U5K74_11670 [Gemmatimonadaceae bacterium]|nr:hypothetical protein [Gemmatimonadaceae bacterium]